MPTASALAKRAASASEGMSENSTVFRPAKARTSITAAEPVKSSPSQASFGVILCSSPCCHRGQSQLTLSVAYYLIIPVEQPLNPEENLQ